MFTLNAGLLLLLHMLLLLQLLLLLLRIVYDNVLHLLHLLIARPRRLQQFPGALLFLFSQALLLQIDLLLVLCIERKLF